VAVSLLHLVYIAMLFCTCTWKQIKIVALWERANIIPALKSQRNTSHRRSAVGRPGDLEAHHQLPDYLRDPRPGDLEAHHQLPDYLRDPRPGDLEAHHQLPDYLRDPTCSFDTFHRDLI